MSAARVPVAPSVLAGTNSQKKTKRPQVAKACLMCKQAKAKCSTTRPCTRCVRMRMAATCYDLDTRPFSSADNGTVTEIDRPVVYRPDPALLGGRIKRLDSTLDVDVLLAENGLQWLKSPFFQGCLEIGFDVRTIVGIYASLPDDWCALLKRTCQTLKKAQQLHRAQSIVDARGGHRLQLPDQVPFVLLLSMACARSVAVSVAGGGGGGPGCSGAFLPPYKRTHVCTVYRM